jgi:phage terminase large subunit
MNAALQQAQRDLTDELTDCYDDPERFFRVFLRVELRRWQKRACDKIRARLEKKQLRISLLIRSCHGAGKTWFVGGLLLWFMACREDARGLTTAPTWKQVADTLWKEIAAMFRGSLLPQLGMGHVLETAYRLRDTWFASGISSDHKENIEGQHSPTAAIRIVDEAKGVDEDMIEATEGIFTAPEILDVWISTPSIQSGPFYERDLGRSASLDVIRIVVDIDELINDPSIPQRDRETFATWKAERAADWGEASPEYKARVMAQYIDHAEDALFPVSWVERAMAQTFQVAGPIAAGQDVAGSANGDENALAIVSGPDLHDRVQLRELASWHERDTMKTKGRAVMTAEGANAQSLSVDVIGLGKGVADAAAADEEHDLPIMEYRASDRPADPTRFVNRKAEDAWNLRGLLEKTKVRLLTPDHPLSQRLKAQMAAIRYEIQPNGKIKVIDPAESPDLFDALLIGLSGLARRGFQFARSGERHVTAADFRSF